MYGTFILSASNSWQNIQRYISSSGCYQGIQREIKGNEFGVQNKCAPLMRLEFVQATEIKCFYTYFPISCLLLFKIHDSFSAERELCAKRSLLEEIRLIFYFQFLHNSIFFYSSIAQSLIIQVIFVH